MTYHSEIRPDASQPDFDVIVVGGGPSGATAAHDLACAGHRVMLLDRAGRVKPCGGAVPPRLLKDFDVPHHLLVAHAKSARIIAPSKKTVTMPVGDGFVGMVDRDVFDEWLDLFEKNDHVVQFNFMGKRPVSSDCWYPLNHPFVQNLMDKMKKDAEKEKNASPKKGNGGKVA